MSTLAAFAPAQLLDNVSRLVTEGLVKLSRNGFKVYDLDTAPPEAVPHLKDAQAQFGFLPNLLTLMAESPETLKGYRTLDNLFLGGTLTKQECLIVQLTASVENNCEYCIAAHGMQSRLAGIDNKVVSAVRSGAPISDARFAALAEMVRQLISNRGAVDEAQVGAFLASGFSRAQLLEVVLGVAVKTISNYTNHLVGAELDRVMRTHAGECAE